MIIKELLLALGLIVLPSPDQAIIQVCSPEQIREGEALPYIYVTDGENEAHIYFVNCVEA